MPASLTELKSYHVRGRDGQIGRIDDLCFRDEDESWIIAYLVVGLEPSGNLVLLASDYIQAIDLGARWIHVSVPREVIVGGPALAAQGQACCAARHDITGPCMSLRARLAERGNL